MSQQTQSKLDALIDEHSASVVGDGYIDIIVLRENIEGFVNKLDTLGIQVNTLTWWCYCIENNDSDCPHGMGGPVYQDGYFSEIVEEHDELDQKNPEELVEFIKNKKTKGSLTFQDNHCLTPAFWLDVPKDWKSSGQSHTAGSN
ncbi:hypothetical protein N8083_01335 [Candidatus Pacebacteria bacterium]|nr:hypothetical protein [Candidatus Paceibacterota bacterium]